MNTQITIIGLGQIGASIGMALKENKNIRRVGCDKDAAVSKAAQSLEVVDEIKNLPAAVKDSAIVVLCLPLGEIRETLRRIGPWLEDNAIVMDTAPIKSGVTHGPGNSFRPAAFILDWCRASIPITLPPSSLV